jgi:hypothetical protein
VAGRRRRRDERGGAACIAVLCAGLFTIRVAPWFTVVLPRPFELL